MQLCSTLLNFFTGMDDIYQLCYLGVAKYCTYTEKVQLPALFP